ncbi:DUF4340 domain-containing protein [Pigmentibacter sp. JX0631]|uniref:DUF4340 domain-containing protein n=1 Tax=Pigmentibacter sp. JX0631 TaxID=2976982 RepID=UPI00246974BD|nr:DUF4340 domain-containing protein [Pigmentibacter sp. JX0631]WGL60923.1 DUF4340 domain-containing protein [Pigmentibacter sp. JX0631]
MKFSTTVGLGVIAIAALVGVYYGEGYYTEKKEEKAKEASFALFFQTKDILKFSIQNSAGNFTFVRDANDKPWRLVTPLQLSADQDAVNNILASIQQLGIQQELVNTENMLTGDKKQLAQFGLETPKLTISVELKKNQEAKLFVGSPLEIGGKVSGSISPASVYAMNPNKTKLLVIDHAFSETIMNKKLEDFRSKRVSTFTKDDVHSFEITNNGKVILVGKSNNNWEVLKPSKWPADSGFVSDYLMRFQGLLAKKIYEKSEINESLLEKFNLKNPVAHISFKDSAGKAIDTFDLSITKEGIYTYVKDGSIAKLNLDLWPDLVPLEKMFKNRLVMLNVALEKINKINLANTLAFVKKDNNWYKITSPNQQPAVSETPNQDAFSFFSNWEFMTADDLILNPSETDLVQFGMTKPLKVFSFEFGTAEKLQPIKIIVGNRVPKNEKNVYLKRSDSPIVYIVDAGWLSLLAQLYSVGDPSNASVKKQME